MRDEYPIRDFIELQGASGRAYRFRPWRAGDDHLAIAGNYVCVRVEGSHFEVVSIGETPDLSGPRRGLSKKVRESTTHVYTRLNVSRATRCAEYEDLQAHETPRMISAAGLSAVRSGPQSTI